MLKLRRDTINQFYAHAKEEFPNECCGAILTDGVQEFVRRCQNIQNERHAEDPATYPRDARTAYLMAPNDVIRVHKEVDTEDRKIKAFYHSHPDEDAYFSEKDKADALWDGRPNYPDVAYVVISLYGKKEEDIGDLKAYAWNDAEEDFVPISVAGDI